ncbi:hypothetical protein DPMN_090800 [Dreissena polymorpha]|uniref:Uncharacterized protein n=1 Tax=Dreissena polymorpha TaxID=45954 RepID=A0A9D4KYE6_DREPO|nr:hypothetical protein DPMN_090800 [Dreissena polymorpha]
MILISWVVQTANYRISPTDYERAGAHRRRSARNSRRSWGTVQSTPVHTTMKDEK